MGRRKAADLGEQVCATLAGDNLVAFLALAIVVGIFYWCFIHPWKVAWDREEKRRLRRAGIYDVDQMDGHEFERFLVLLFQRLGYVVEQTRATGDFGADLIIEKHEERALVQAKRSARNVSPKAVQEVVAAKALYKCARAIVVTNQRYTKSAEALAVANNVELWDRNRLVTAILTVLPEPTPPASGEWHPLLVTLLRVTVIFYLILIILWAISRSHA